MRTAVCASSAQASPKPTSSKASPFPQGGCSISHAIFDQLQHLRSRIDDIYIRSDTSEGRFAHKASQIQDLEHQQHMHSNQLEQLQRLMDGGLDRLYKRMAEIEKGLKTSLEASRTAMKRWEDDDEWNACCDQMQASLPNAANLENLKRILRGDDAQISLPSAASLEKLERIVHDEVLPKLRKSFDGMGGTGDSGLAQEHSANDGRLEESFRQLQVQVKSLQVASDNSIKDAQPLAGQPYPTVLLQPTSVNSVDETVFNTINATVKDVENRVDGEFVNFDRRVLDLQSKLDQKEIQWKSVEFEVPDLKQKVESFDRDLQGQLTKSKELEVLVHMLRQNFLGQDARLNACYDRVAPLPANTMQPPGPPLQTQQAIINVASPSAALVPGGAAAAKLSSQDAQPLAGQPYPTVLLQPTSVNYSDIVEFS